MADNTRNQGQGGQGNQGNQQGQQGNQGNQGSASEMEQWRTREWTAGQLPLGRNKPPGS